MATDLRILRMAIHAPLKVFCHEHENYQLNRKIHQVELLNNNHNSNSSSQ